MSYEYHESYKHKLAKELLYQWLKEIHDDPSVDGSCDHEFGQTLPFFWRRNYGVFLELPFHTTSDPYYFENSEGLCCEHDRLLYVDPNSKGKKCTCEFNETGFLKEYDRGPFLFVPDITIFHKGTAKILIEVTHTNPLSPTKINKISTFFNGHLVEVYEISADNILEQTNKRRVLKFYEVPITGQEYFNRFGKPGTLEEIRSKYKNNYL